jgi:Ni2+-binding GTPase involved in maturation of urease and hydrogenase
MRLHLVNGFLGSGKTTAIIAAARHYLQQGKKVAIVTNDKGRFQVDAAFFQSSQIPTAQVAGGCFRCSFDEFQEQISSLNLLHHPDIIFAESVGSCVDLVNPVFPPLQTVLGIRLEGSTFSVFTDVRLFHRWISGQQLPFSDSIVYTYEKQIDESALLVLNKIDLLPPEARKLVFAEAQQRFPAKWILFQNSLRSEGELPWFRYLDNKNSMPAHPGFQVDYGLYMDAERKMAWYDRMFLVHPGRKSTSLHQWVITFLSHLLQSLINQRIPVAHLKFFCSDTNERWKLSFTAMDLMPEKYNEDWQKAIPHQLTGPLKMIVNARVEMKGYLFGEMMDRAIVNAGKAEEVNLEIMSGMMYHPEVLPVPQPPTFQEG